MRLNRMQKREERTAWIFVLPFLIGLCVFSIFPILYTFLISLMDFNSMGGLKNMKFVGLDNFRQVFESGPMMDSFLRTGLYMVIYVPLVTFLSLLLAIAINRPLHFRNVSRALILVPYVSNVVAIAIVWSIILNPYDGPINTALRGLGMENPPLWLGGVNSALPTAALIAVWQNMAFQMVVFLAALQEVPEELYESALLDGANAWQKFRNITLPIISPTTFFLTITAIINSTQNFSLIKSLTDGGPGRACEVIAVSVYNTAFEFSHYSVAAAQSMILFLILMVVTVIQWKGQKLWVHY